MDSPNSQTEKPLVIGSFVHSIEASPNERMTKLWDKYLALSPWRYRWCRCWNDLKGKNWMALLMDHPEFAEVCDWTKLSGDNWAKLLAKRPEFAEQWDKWSEMDGGDWATLLKAQPHFADRCTKWDEFRDLNWMILLIERPEFATHCD